MMTVHSRSVSYFFIKVYEFTLFQKCTCLAAVPWRTTAMSWTPARAPATTTAGTTARLMTTRTPTILKVPIPTYPSNIINAKIKACVRVEPQKYKDTCQVHQRASLRRSSILSPKWFGELATRVVVVCLFTNKLICLQQDLAASKNQPTYQPRLPAPNRPSGPA